jgi:MFS transporter, ACS family, solute carrier family 17 (sodium-dependent inorganic phosphate cotransporter), other
MSRTPAIWALVANNFAFHYIVYVLMAWLPTYYEHGLHMDLGCVQSSNTT